MRLLDVCLRVVATNALASQPRSTALVRVAPLSRDLRAGGLAVDRADRHGVRLRGAHASDRAGQSAAHARHSPSRQSGCRQDFFSDPGRRWRPAARQCPAGQSGAVSRAVPAGGRCGSSRLAVTAGCTDLATAHHSSRRPGPDPASPGAEPARLSGVGDGRTRSDAPLANRRSVPATHTRILIALECRPRDLQDTLQSGRAFAFRATMAVTPAAPSAAHPAPRLCARWLSDIWLLASPQTVFQPPHRPFSGP